MTSAVSSPLIRHNATITGKGETTILFAHGYGCDKSVWRGITPAFEDGFRVVTFDHAGAGGCDRHAYNNFRHSTLAGYADDLIALCENLASQRLILVGHSVGAMIGALAAISRPDLFDLLVMIGPSASYINDGDYRGGFDRVDLMEFLDLAERNFQGWGEALATLAMGNRDRPELTEDLRDRICRTDPAVAGVFARVTFLTDLRDDLARLTTPTVIFQCQDDPVAPPTAIAQVHNSVRGSRVIELSATGHCTHVSHPQVVAEALQSVLSDAELWTMRT